MAAQGKTDEFELKLSLLHHIPKYHGLSIEDPNKLLKEFEVVCLSMTSINVDGNILKMKAFPFSLMDNAKDWLYELALGTVTFWESMKIGFMEKLFPTSRVILLRKRISGIQQNQGESFPAYYERQMLDASAEGALVDKTPVAAKILVANRTLNAQQYEGVVDGSKVQGAAVCVVCSMQGHLNDQCPQLIENGGWESANVGQQNQAKEMSEVKKQIGEMAAFLGQFREKAITLRSGKEVGSKPNTSKLSQNEDDRLLLEKEEMDKATERKETILPQPPKDPKPSNSGRVVPNLTHSNPIPPNAHFPRRFMQAKNEEDEKDILETFRKVHVNIPLRGAIKQIPKYAKFFKKLCPIRKRIQEKEVVHVSGNVSAMLQRKLPSKCKDQGSFTIPCVIGNARFEHAMLDLGASINVMPYSVYASMNLGELKNDGVIIQLVDRSNAYPKGILEDVLVQVPNRIQGGGTLYIDFRKLNAIMRNDHYPLPFIDPLYGNFEEHVREDIPLHAVDYNGT
ncbi:uncharacterized protein [Malus domestica]|uniref:uncharacterized protein n=1 Tax=Malus domestica TaxID=3750 RepID=UPI003977079B